MQLQHQTQLSCQPAAALKTTEMEMMMRTQPAHCSVPLSSRLDHLDFIMKCLEGKRGLGSWGRSNQTDGSISERPLLPCDSAPSTKDSCYKGSLFDRVASLENRLFQLCLELESSSTSSTSTATGVTTTTTITSGYASSSQGSKGETSHHSLPIFSKPNHLQIVKPDSHHQSAACKSQIQRKSQAVEEIKQIPTSSEQKVDQNNKSTNKQKVSKSVKKKVSSKWPHFKLLGC